jgi:two-component system, cell cycle sensor histidine kinase and response regulator CckA
MVLTSEPNLAMSFGLVQSRDLPSDVDREASGGTSVPRPTADFYRAIFETSEDAKMVVAPPEWRFVAVNRAAMALFGVKSEAEFLSLSPWNVSPAHQPDGRASEEAAVLIMEQAMREGSHSFEWHHQSRDGRDMPVMVVLSRLEFAGQRLLQATLRDLRNVERALSALRASEEQLLKIFDNSSNAIAFTERGGGRILNVNETWVRSTGITREQALGQTAVSLGLWPSQEARDLCMAALEPEGRLREYETILLFRGQPRHFAINIECVDLGRTQHLLWEFRDITDRKQAEEARLRYELLASQGRDIVLFIRRDDGRILDGNAAAIAAYGYRREELLSLAITDLRASETRPLAKQQLAAADRTGLRFETVHRRKDGSTFPVEVNSDGATLGGVRLLMSVIRDISERKSADELIYLLRESIDVHPDGAYWMDGHARFVYVNKEGHRMLGYGPGELLGKHVSCVNPPVDDDRMQRVWDLLRREGSYRAESVHVRRDGTTIPVEILTTLVRLGDQEYACGFARDISERKRAEAENAKLQAQLAHAQKMESVGRLAGGVAHDFNNMLGVILGHCELAVEKVNADNDIRGDLSGIRKAAQRSAELTRQLLAFARKQTISPKVLDLNKTVEEILRMVRRLIGEDIRLDWRPGQDVGSVFADAIQIDQILANLCVNARDAISDIGTITIASGNKRISAEDNFALQGATPGEYVWFSVTDDGCGMDADTRARVYEPFFTTKGVGKGTGLGLATVYGIVEQNHGFIDLRSEVGQGTAFTIHLPRHTAKVEVTRVEPELKQPRGQETILLVEDEAPLLHITRRMLEKHGYRLLAAVSPGQALQLAREYHGTIDMLLTDVIMPEMTGRELARQILSLYPQAKCVFMSGYTADIIAHQGKLEEGVLFLQKPFTAPELLNLVRQGLERRSV